MFPFYVLFFFKTEHSWTFIEIWEVGTVEEKMTFSWVSTEYAKELSEIFNGKFNFCYYYSYSVPVLECLYLLLSTGFPSFRMFAVCYFNCIWNFLLETTFKLKNANH